MKHLITLLWYVSTTSQSFVVVTPCIYYCLYYVSKLLCHDFHLVGFQVSFTHHIKHHLFSSTNQEGNKRNSWDYKLAELLLHLKTRTIAPPKESCPSVRVGVWIKIRVSFRVGNNQTISPKENCPLVRAKVWPRVGR